MPDHHETYTIGLVKKSGSMLTQPTTSNDKEVVYANRLSHIRQWDEK